jgi:hypothetical protein
VLVTDPEEIRYYLEELHGEPGAINDSYFFITTKEPDARVIDSLLDRAYGKPKDQDDGIRAPEAVLKQFEAMVEGTQITVKGKTLELFNTLKLSNGTDQQEQQDQ